MNYSFFVSSACGVYLGILLLGYCLALGLRVAKLAFYEILAPIPILMSVLPSKKDSFNKWLKEVSTTFLSVFVRIAILYVVVYLVILVKARLDSDLDFFGLTLGGFDKFIVGAIIVLGIVSFAKKAPEYLKAATGIETQGIGMGWKAIKEGLKDGGLFTAGALAGGALLTGGRRIGEQIDKVRGNKKYKEKTANETKEQKRLRRKNNAALYAKNSLGFAGGFLGGAIRGGISGGKGSGEYSSPREAWDAAKKARDEESAKRSEKLYEREKRANKYLANTTWSEDANLKENVVNFAKDFRSNQKAVRANLGSAIGSGMADGFLGLGETTTNIEKAKKEQAVKDYIRKNPDIIKLSAEDYIKKHAGSLYATPELTKEFRALTKALEDATKSGNVTNINQANANLTAWKANNKSLLEIESAIEVAKKSGDSSAIANATQAYKDLEKSIKDNFVAHVSLDPEAIKEQTEIKLSIENLKTSIKSNASSATVKMMVDGVEGVSKGLLDTASDVAGRIISDLSEALDVLEEKAPDKLIKLTNKITEYSGVLSKSAIDKVQEQKTQKEIDKK